MNEDERETEFYSVPIDQFNGSDTRLPGAVDFGASFVISGFLAIVFKSMIAPLERIKLILQTQASSPQIGGTERIAYSGVFNALVRIPQEQGFLSLWRGNLLNISRYFPAQAINFSLYDLYYNALEQIVQPRTPHSEIILPFMTGGAVGFTSCMIFYPFNFCITRISVDVGDNKMVQREFNGLSDCLRKIYKSVGYRGFYQGLSFATSAVFLFRSIYFGLYTYGKHTYLNHFATDRYKMNAPVMVSLTIAQLSSMFATIVAYPLDTISRQKMLCCGRGDKKFTPLRQVVNNIIKQDGPVGFYRGISANLMTSICGSLVLVTYDIVKSHFDKLIESKRSKPKT